MTEDGEEKQIEVGSNRFNFLRLIVLMVEFYYSLPGNGAGGCLHIVLDDGNLEDSSVLFCLNYCKENNDIVGEKIAELLMTITEDERQFVYERYGDTI